MERGLKAAVSTDLKGKNASEEMETPSRVARKLAFSPSVREVYKRHICCM
jgi:hypothetical protein